MIAGSNPAREVRFIFGIFMVKSLRQPDVPSNKSYCVQIKL
jgi:hypothetical protein